MPTSLADDRGRSRLARSARTLLLLLSVSFASATVLAAEADRRVSAALLALAHGDLAGADAELRAALEAAPDFEIATVLRADVERRRAGLPSLLDQDGGVPAGVAAADWQRWRREVTQRALPHRIGLYAAGVHLVPTDVEMLLIAETARNQLHVLRRAAAGWQVTDTLYLSIGRRGVGKQVPGDRRTPLGLYWIVDRLEDHQLPARYGPLAFPLDYPNAWDASNERRGDGIWLHGTDPDTYARPPLDSDGCLVLSDADLLALAAELKPGVTPVLVARQWSFVDGGAGTAAPVGIAAALEAWLVGWQHGSANAQLPPVALDDVSVDALFAADYPDEPDMVVLRFRLRGSVADAERTTWKRLYLRRQADGEWRVAAEGNG